MRTEKKNWKNCFLGLLLVFFLYPMCSPPLPVGAEPAPTPTGSILIPISIDWSHVEESDVPAELNITIVPDGLPWMASSFHFGQGSEWNAQLEVIPGTQSLVIQHADVPGLENRLSGSMESGYTISYYKTGEAPAQATTALPVSAPAAVTSTIASTAPALAQTSSLRNLPSEGQINESDLARELAARGVTPPNKSLYLIGIIACLILIFIFIFLRLLLQRR